MALAVSGLCCLLLFRLRFGQAGEEGGLWRPAVHAAALVGTFRIIAGEVVVENRLHLADGLEPGVRAFDPEVLVEQGAVEALGDAIGLRPLDPRSPVLDLFQLQEQLVRVLVGAAAVFPAIAPSE